MTLTPGTMTDYELKAEIEHHRALIAELSPGAPAKASLQVALDTFIRECDERSRLRSGHIAQAEAAFPDNAS